VNGDNRLGNNLARHLPLDCNAFDSHSAEALDIGFAFNGYMPRGEATRKFSNEVDRRTLGAMQITAELSLNQSRIANDSRAVEIPFRSNTKVATRANRSVEPGCDFVIADIDMRATSRTSCRACRVTHFTFPVAFKTLDYQVTSPLPKALEFFNDRGILDRGRLFLGTGL
jgi:hypothetical protein